MLCQSKEMYKSERFSNQIVVIIAEVLQKVCYTFSKNAFLYHGYGVHLVSSTLTRKGASLPSQTLSCTLKRKKETLGS